MRASAEVLQAAVRPEATTRATRALWAKSLLNAVLFFAVFMVALPWLFHRLLPSCPRCPAPLPNLAGRQVASSSGSASWVACLDAFSRHGRGTPLPMDAPRGARDDGGPFSVDPKPDHGRRGCLVIWGEALYLLEPRASCCTRLLSPWEPMRRFAASRSPSYSSQLRGSGYEDRSAATLPSERSECPDSRSRNQSCAPRQTRTRRLTPMRPLPAKRQVPLTAARSAQPLEHLRVRFGF